MSPAQTIKIKIAETKDERRAAYRLRYQVFTEELGDERYADHELMEFKDSDDVEDSILFVAVEDDEVVGSVRLKPLGNRDCIGIEAYNLASLATHLDQELDSLKRHAAVLDRFVIQQKFRGEGLHKQLFALVQKTAVQSEIRVLLAAVETSKPHICKLYECEFGAREYAKTIWCGIPFNNFYANL